jgi:L-ascorbate metabolism protein UlaG (beta-lactamase superfamily)
MESNYPQTEHYDGIRFYNQDKSIQPKGLRDVIKWMMTSKWDKWPSKVDIQPTKPKEKAEVGFSVTFIGHACFLIQTQGLNILTDPVYSLRTSPLSFSGPKRVHEPGIRFEDLPPIDVVFISHNHYDHMDSVTVKKLSEKFSPLFVTPLGNKSYLENFGAKSIVELDWWEFHEIKKDFKITLTPAQHWSNRSQMDKNKSLWGGCMIKSKTHSLFFAGDTGYGRHFKETAEKLGHVDIALLPIGAYEPRWFMKDIHMNPEDAVLAHMDLHAKQSIAMHFGMFQLTNEGIDVPLKDLEIAKAKHKVENFKTLRPGQNFVINKTLFTESNNK